jgi:hypothetical protein
MPVAVENLAVFAGYSSSEPFYAATFSLTTSTAGSGGIASSIFMHSSALAKQSLSVFRFPIDDRHPPHARRTIITLRRNWSWSQVRQSRMRSAATIRPTQPTTSGQRRYPSMLSCTPRARRASVRQRAYESLRAVLLALSPISPPSHVPDLDPRPVHAAFAAARAVRRNPLLKSV